MKPFDLDNLLAQMRQALELNQLDDAIHTLESLRTPDQADLLAELDEEDQIALVTRLGPAASADILEELEDEEAADLMEALPTETAIRIVEEMADDEAADVLGDIEPAIARSILAGMEDSEDIHPLMLHAEDSAGGLMTSEILVLRRRTTAGEALEAVRRWQPDSQPVYDLFVVDSQGRLSGVVNLHQLVVSPADRPVGDIMEGDVIAVLTGTDQEECARLMSRYDLLALPVVDCEPRLLGVITIDDVMEVLEDEATEDIQRMGGALPLDQPYLSSRVLEVARKRVGWLMLLFITESLTGTVLRHFEDQLQTVVALAFFVPLLIGTGGNAGSQTTSTIIRALAVGDIDTREAARALWHELRVGLLLGLGMGVFAFVRALTWHTTPGLAATVSMAIFTIVVWANGLGAILPLLASKLRIDPTVVSGPVMSTLVDATGLFIYFTIARMALGI
jgi:magnesium transporter